MTAAIFNLDQYLEMEPSPDLSAQDSDAIVHRRMLLEFTARVVADLRDFTGNSGAGAASPRVRSDWVERMDASGGSNRHLSQAAQAAANEAPSLFDVEALADRFYRHNLALGRGTADYNALKCDIAALKPLAQAQEWALPALNGGQPLSPYTLRSLGEAEQSASQLANPSRTTASYPAL